ncbi:monocopper oxidase-like protein SKU5 [Miscanthus floridulus]|uniref:monocopper oxidase-like protein SKU5 n=1 Tax=Miscanthus floridulus TaxID=154761 RepID=UPI003459A061
MPPLLLLLLLAAALAPAPARAGDPYAYYDWEVSYVSAQPLGVKQKVIGINGQFPGPPLNVTTNWNVVVNVRNALDEPLLLTWNGVQQRKTAWQDGVLGTNCAIPAGWNWTYTFQVKDQVGSFFYFPSTPLHRAAGGYGAITINNRDVIPIPFGFPDGDITLFIGDWYNRGPKELRRALDGGTLLGAPDGVLINGLGPYQYNESVVPPGIVYERINVEPGKTYRFRVHNVGVSTSLNFRIQNHNLLLVETEGSYTSQQNYTNLDIHVGQSYSFLVTMDQNASTDYYVVASARFVDAAVVDKLTGVAILHYSNSQGPASGPLPDPPNDQYDTAFSINQARSIRWNVTASGARPNPQGSFHYGDITVTDVYVLQSRVPELIDGKLRSTLNEISYIAPSTPLVLAQIFNVPGVFKLDFPNHPMNRLPIVDTSIINGTYKGFMEIIFQNNATNVQSYHLDGYAFFVVGMDYGLWTENSRGTYNKWDGVARSTIQVFPGAWTAILVFLDNAGIWNLRVQNLDTWYLGQEVYINVVNPEDNSSTLPDNAIFCGALSSLQKFAGRDPRGEKRMFRARYWVSRLDCLFDNSHWTGDQQVLRKRKTELGGTFSVASLIIFTGLLTVLLYQAIKRRSLEMHRVKSANAPDLLSFVNDLEFHITTVSSMSCTQAVAPSTVAMGTPGFMDFRVVPLPALFNYSCTNTSQGPSITLRCNGCRVPPRDHYVSWQFVDLPGQPATAVGFQFNLTARQHGNNQHMSFVSGTMNSDGYADDGKLKTFRGRDSNVLKIQLFPQIFNLGNLRLLQPLVQDFTQGSTFSDVSSLNSSLQNPRDGVVNITLYISYLSDYIVEISNESVVGPVSILASIGGLYAFSVAICLCLMAQCEARIKKLHDEDTRMLKILSKRRAQRNWNKVRKFVMYTWGLSSLDPSDRIGQQPEGSVMDSLHRRREPIRQGI